MHPILFIFLVILGIIVLFFTWLSISWLLVDTKKQYKNDSPYYRFLLVLSTRILLILCGVSAHMEGA